MINVILDFSFEALAMIVFSIVVVISMIVALFSKADEKYKEFYLMFLLSAILFMGLLLLPLNLLKTEQSKDYRKILEEKSTGYEKKVLEEWTRSTFDTLGFDICEITKYNSNICKSYIQYFEQKLKDKAKELETRDQNRQEAIKNIKNMQDN